MSRRPNKNLKFHVRRAVVKMVFFVPKAPLRVTQADDAPHVHPHPSARYNAAMCKRKQKEGLARNRTGVAGRHRF